MHRPFFPIVLLFVLSLCQALHAQEKGGLSAEEREKIRAQAREKLQQPASETTDESGTLMDDEREPNPYFELLVPPDRNMERRFEQAKRLIEAGRLAEAAQLLGSILENPIDFFIPPPYSGSDSNPNDRTTDKSFGRMVFETLQGLPSKARESYILQYETQAKRLLEEAVHRGSFEGLQRVARNYFPTDSGATATFLIGMNQFEQGDWEAALLTFQRLEEDRHHSSLSYEPMLSLSLATCQLRLGRDADAKTTARRFLERFPEPSILLAGKEPWTPKTADEMLAKLEQSVIASETVAPSDWLEQTGWFLALGTTTQNPETRADLPLLELLWAVPTLSQPVFSAQSNMLHNMILKAKETYIPAVQPLLVRDHLLIRGLGEITAVDRKTGKRIWSAAEPEYRLPFSVQSPFRLTLRQLGSFPQYHRFVLRMFFWHDRITNQMSSDGTRLFTVEEMDLFPANYNQWGGGQRNMQFRNRSLEDPRMRAGNTLAARDVETGKLLWMIGKFPYAQKVFDQLDREIESEKAEKEKKEKEKKEPNSEAENKKNDSAEKGRSDSIFSEEELFLSETWFLGAPLPMKGKLYSIGENAGILRLFILDAATGKLIAQQPILQPPTSFETDWLRRYYGLTPSASDGLILCPTGLGMVVALDADTAIPTWCFSYSTPVEEDPNERNRFQNNRYFHYGTNGSNEEIERMFAKTGWQVPVVMIDDGRVLVAPPDIPSLYCLDLPTGKLLWKREDFKREHALYVACIRNGTAYIVTPKSMLALSMDNGEPVWEFILDEKERLKKTYKKPLAEAISRIRPTARKSNDNPSNSNENKNTPDGEVQASAASMPSLVFPDGLRPGGIGGRTDNRYFLPFSNGFLGIVDLDTGSLELVSSFFPPTRVDKISEIPSPAASPDSILGNLIGLQGRLYCQTPFRLVSFDQWESLRKRAEELLQKNPEDSEGLFQMGRIRCAEGNLAQGVELFRRSLRIKRSEAASDALRRSLLHALRENYASWSNTAGELESLAEFPEELGEILYVLAQGALKEGKTDEFIETLKKAIRLEIDHSIQVVIDPELTSQLHRALGLLIEQRIDRDHDPRFKEQLQQVADTIFRHFESEASVDEILPESVLSENPALVSNRFLTRPWWEEDSLFSSMEIRRRQIFLELFRPLPAARQAEDSLKKIYEQHRLFTSLEMMLNPPVLREVPGIATPSGNSSGKDDPITLKSPPETPDSPPDFVETFPQRDALEHLADILESQGNTDDSYYYYRMIKNHFAEQGETIYREALERCPELKRRHEEWGKATDWPTGNISFTDIDGENNAANVEHRNPHGWGAINILRTVRSQGHFASSRGTIPLQSPYEPFLSPNVYAMETTHQESFLACFHSDGTERWRFELSNLAPDMGDYGYISDGHNHYRQNFSEQPIFLKGGNHLLLFVRADLLIALDTFVDGEENVPKILWTKRLSGPLTSRQMFSAMSLSQLAQQGSRWFPKESIIVTPHAVCYQDAEKIFGLDPTTGRTIWTRDLDSTPCSIQGGRNHLFLVFPETLRALALDPASGKELAEGTIPPNGVFAFGTNLVFIEQESSLSGGRKNTYKLSVADLRDLFLQPRQKPETGVNEETSSKTPEPTIPTYSIREGLLNTSLVRPVLSERFLATVSWETKTLQLYDPYAKRDVFGLEGDWGRRSGAKLPDPENKELRWHDCDFDVELFGDKLLVHFTEKRGVDSSQKNVVEDGVPLQRSCNVVTNVACRGIGAGSLMLYDFEGNPCWKEPARVKDWFRLLNVSDRSPIVLYAVAFSDRERSGTTHFSTGLLGIDKNTGEKRFEKLIPPLKTQLLQGFRVQIDPKRHEIDFLGQAYSVRARFTNDAVQVPDAPEKNSKEKTPLKNATRTILDELNTLLN